VLTLGEGLPTVQSAPAGQHQALAHAGRKPLLTRGPEHLQPRSLRTVGTAVLEHDVQYERERLAVEVDRELLVELVDRRERRNQSLPGRTE
jgi:hypothetical protein